MPKSVESSLEDIAKGLRALNENFVAFANQSKASDQEKEPPTFDEVLEIWAVGKAAETGISPIELVRAANRFLADVKPPSESEATDGS